MAGGRALPNLGLRAFFDLGEDYWDADDANNDYMSTNLLKLSVLVQGRVLSKVSATPGAPTSGDVHLFDETHATQANKIAVYDVDTWKYITPLEGWMMYNEDAGYVEKFSGTAWSEFTPGAAAAAYDFGFMFEDTPGASAVVGRVRIGRNITIPANMAGASGGVSANPTATFAVDVKDDGASIGTISVSTGGVVTFTTSGGTSKSVAAGSEITFVAPGSADATVAGMSAVILATVD